MYKKLFNDEDLLKVINYEIPPLITLSGCPGSGKTMLARSISSSLKIYLISNDYVRRCLLQNNSNLNRTDIQGILIAINSLRLGSLLLHRIPFVLDADINSLRKIRELELLSKMFKYKIVKIRLEANNDSVNIDRIQSRALDYTKENLGVIGDDVRRSPVYGEEAYYAVKLRKPLQIPMEYFDYVIFNDDNDIGKFQESASQVISGISRGLVKK